jgi:hypothetical protein
VLLVRRERRADDGDDVEVAAARGAYEPPT